MTPQTLTTYTPNFISAGEAQNLLDLATTGGWVQPSVHLFGKHHPTPRKMLWMAPPTFTYSWSGVVLQPTPVPAWLLVIMGRIQAWGGIVANSALINLYRDGQDTVGWHSDDEPELGASPAVACVSVGAQRDLVLRMKADHKVKLTLPLEDRSLVVMLPGCQGVCDHSVPRRARVKDLRISATFRYVC